MPVATPVIGIPKWGWKTPLIRQAEARPRLEKLEISEFCYECDRHFELLKSLDAEKDIMETAYYKYQRKRRRSHKGTVKKIQNFRSLYNGIKKKGCKNPPIVTPDGCRLNGSHRLAILIYLGVKEANINVANYGEFFNSRVCRRIRRQIRKYRKEIYDL